MKAYRKDKRNKEITFIHSNEPKKEVISIKKMEEGKEDKNTTESKHIKPSKPKKETRKTPKNKVTPKNRLINQRRVKTTN